MADKAITMFIDLRQWEEAKVFAASSGGSVDTKELTRRQAEWAEEVSEACCARWKRTFHAGWGLTGVALSVNETRSLTPALVCGRMFALLPATNELIYTWFWYEGTTHTESCGMSAHPHEIQVFPINGSDNISERFCLHE